MPGRGFRGGFGGRRSFGGRSRAAGRSSGRRRARQDGRGAPDRQQGTWSPTRSTTPGESASTWGRLTTPGAGPPSMRGTADCPAEESWWWSPGRCPGTQPSNWRRRRSRVIGAGPGSCRGITGHPTASTLNEVEASKQPAGDAQVPEMLATADLAEMVDRLTRAATRSKPWWRFWDR